MIGINQIILDADLLEYKDYILAEYKKISSQKFDEMSCEYFVSKEAQTAVLQRLKILAEETKINYYTAELLLILACGVKLKSVYERNGIPFYAYQSFLEDIKVKTDEGIYKFKVVGLEDANWLGLYFTFQLFSFGRLGYEIISGTDFDYKGAKRIDKEQFALTLHIPSGKKLVREDIVNSLTHAYEFFKDKRIDGVLPILCSSWLLYRPYLEIFEEGTNLRAFCNLFDVLKDVEYSSFTNSWRVYGTRDISDLSVLPQKTSLQRKFIDWIKRDKKHGYGVGVLLFDGQNILTDKN